MNDEFIKRMNDEFIKRKIRETVRDVASLLNHLTMISHIVDSFESVNEMDEDCRTELFRALGGIMAIKDFISKNVDCIESEINQ